VEPGADRIGKAVTAQYLGCEQAASGLTAVWATPSLLIAARKDREGANLDRVQVVKGGLAADATLIQQERAFSSPIW
jgi:hypothetical protein